jgi:hypothetical protein
MNRAEADSRAWEATDTPTSIRITIRRLDVTETVVCSNSTGN